MTPEYNESYAHLSDIQRDGVDWGDGPLLVLAGPGAGKTKVLTTRLARIILETPEKHFRILALTFTNKAAAEMRTRVDVLAPGSADERAFIGTFHAFCTQILRQHGSHIGIQPDFAIFSQRHDCEALLKEAITEARTQGQAFQANDVGWLTAIDEMKKNLILPVKARTKFRDPHMADVYELYEDALQRANGLDFNGLILNTCRLLHEVPAVATRLRRSYPFWMIDEFQDTSPGQYWLIRYLAGDDFNNIVVVADDDQIIYQWAGASYRQLEKFRTQFSPTLVQLVENHRCPPEIVAVANRLVGHNTQRTPDKQPTIPARATPLDALNLRQFESDADERQFISDDILARGAATWGKTAVIGRTRQLLEPALASLKERGIPARLWQRRDAFISPHFAWLHACLDQAHRPLDRRVFTTLVDAGNRVLGLTLEPDVLIAEAKATGHTFIEHWGLQVAAIDDARAHTLAAAVQELANARGQWPAFVKTCIAVLVEASDQGPGAITDLGEDSLAWKACILEIRAETGHDPTLAEVVQGMALRSKEPPPDPDGVILLTVHGSKGLEFDNVYVIGLAEDELPSWQSIKKGDSSPEMEEERRNCFVAITRTRESLTLTAAGTYRGRERSPSRFLREMALLD